MPRAIYLPAYLQVCECAEALGSGVAELIVACYLVGLMGSLMKNISG